VAAAAVAASTSREVATAEADAAAAAAAEERTGEDAAAGSLSRFTVAAVVDFSFLLADTAAEFASATMCFSREVHCEARVWAWARKARSVMAL
jgi:hypothetical protein